MSLPQTTTMKPTQSSIKSFFQPRQQPSYAPPPPSSKFAPAPGAAAAPPAPASKPPTTTTSTTTPPPPTTTSPATAPPASTPLTSIPPSTPLHPQAAILPVTDQDLQPLRRINSLLLPVAYPETFYAAALTGPFSRVITWSDPATSTTQVVGGVVARIEPSPFPPPASSTRPEHALYIQSLALLSPYRSHGLATAAIDHLVAAAASSSPAVNLRHIYAHVWTDNEEGMHWYAARGFERYGDALQGYYIKLRPDSAYIVRRAVGPLSLGSQQSSSAAAPTAPVPGPTAAVANLPPMNTSNGGPTAPNGQSPTSAASDGPTGQSFQNRRAETEWNDLPADMAPSMLAPPRSNGGGSGASSRSSSSARKKKDRSYPAAAFAS